MNDLPRNLESLNSAENDKRYVGQFSRIALENSLKNFLNAILIAEHSKEFVLQ